VSGLILTANTTGASYQWVDCNNANSPIAGETNQSFTVTAVGSYAVEVTQNNCVKTSPCITISNISVNKLNGKTTNLIIYPNPSTGMFTITYSGTKQIPYSLTDITGKVIQTGVLNSGDNNLNIAESGQGVYLFHAGGNTTRLIKN